MERLIPTGVLAATGLVGAAVGFEPIWAGQYLDRVYLGWPVSVTAITLAVLAVVTWRAVRGKNAEASQAALVIAAVAGLVVGGAVGFMGSLEWLLHLVVPPAPGHIGYLPHWPWQAVSGPLGNRIVPALVAVALWVAGIGLLVRRLGRERAATPRPAPD